MVTTARLPVGVSDFKKLTTEGYTFIDKTKFIKEVMDDGAQVILITRPRRFGKTLSLSMLHYFLQKNQMDDQNIFEHLDIAQEIDFCRAHQRQYPVIFVSFKDVKYSSYEKAFVSIVELMESLYSDHAYLLNENILLDHERTKFLAIPKAVQEAW